MEVHIYSVYIVYIVYKAKSQDQIYNDNTKRPKPKENQLGILGISSRKFTHYVGNSAEGLESRRIENFCLIYWCLIYFCLIFF